MLEKGIKVTLNLRNVVVDGQSVSQTAAVMYAASKASPE